MKSISQTFDLWYLKFILHDPSKRNVCNHDCLDRAITPEMYNLTRLQLFSVLEVSKIMEDGTARLTHMGKSLDHGISSDL